ncbi:lipid A-modifier LpxR family protein [uncultured Phenylobacterium sp.]|uniref:lipid A-modifier LpxR family protein n=1 Tax=uncultured Phenylobacterium sp. TaxID=349273 RepID=UPI0025F596C2|nr:lipid A-modifier LpxR family protein [uncultured Phenylobacterium sp.]
MRWAALFAVTLSCAGPAAAQTPAPDLTAALSLKAAAFAPAPARDLELRVTYAEVLRAPLYAPGALDRAPLDVTLIRTWPRAVSFASEHFEFDIAPHAGFGVGARGGKAEGGATLIVGKRPRGEQAMARLREMGVADGASYGDAGRFYVFAAASGQAIGLNMMRGAEGWGRAGWSTDATGALVGDAQVGVGWRKGDVQSSFGVIHREVKGRHMVFGQTTRDDTLAAFTFSIQPGR